MNPSTFPVLLWIGTNVVWLLTVAFIAGRVITRMDSMKEKLDELTSEIAADRKTSVEVREAVWVLREKVTRLDEDVQYVQSELANCQHCGILRRKHDSK